MTDTHHDSDMDALHAAARSGRRLLRHKLDKLQLGFFGHKVLEFGGSSDDATGLKKRRIEVTRRGDNQYEVVDMLYLNNGQVEGGRVNFDGLIKPVTTLEGAVEYLDEQRDGLEENQGLIAQKKKLVPRASTHKRNLPTLGL